MNGLVGLVHCVWFSLHVRLGLSPRVSDLPPVIVCFVYKLVLVLSVWVLVEIG